MPVGLNPNIQKTQQTQQTQGTQSTKINEGKQGGDGEVAAEFKEGSKFSLKNANGNTGLTYTASAENDKKAENGGMTQSEINSANSSGRAKTAEAKSASASGKALQQQSTASSKTFVNESNSAIQSINDQASTISSESANIDSASGRLNSVTAKQDSIKAWIENNSPSVEEMTVQMQQLTDEAFQMIADAGITEEFASLDEAMEAISEMIDPDVMETYQEKLEERDALQEEVEGLPDDDPEKADKMAELEGLNAGLEPGGEFNPETDLGIDMASLSELQANLADNMAAIGELGANIDAYHETLDSKESELSSLSSKASSEKSSIDNSKNNIKQASIAADEFKSALQQPEEEQAKTADALHVTATVTKSIGTTAAGVGGGLIPATPTTAVGIALLAAGLATEATGLGMEAAAKGLDKDYANQTREANSAAQAKYNEDLAAEQAQFDADQMSMFQNTSSTDSTKTLSESRKKTEKPVGPSGGEAA